MKKQKKKGLKKNNQKKNKVLPSKVFIPKTNQEIISYMFKEIDDRTGIFRLDEDTYSICIEYSDVSFAKANDEEAENIFFKWLGWIVGVFCFLLFVSILVAHIGDYSEKKNAINNDQVLVVEGYVEKYHAMPFEGHDTEHFEINGVYFEYSNFELYNGYNRPACYGGVVTENGQNLKIKYVTDITGKNIILYIERIE